MLRWLWNTLWAVGWYVLVASGWVCWWRAHQTARRLDHELRVMAHSWRYAANKKE